MALGRESAHVVDVELGERAQILARTVVEERTQVMLIRGECVRRESALVLELL
jgi:hypothetical protein